MPKEILESSAPATPENVSIVPVDGQFVACISISRTAQVNSPKLPTEAAAIQWAINELKVK